MIKSLTTCICLILVIINTCAAFDLKQFINAVIDSNRDPNITRVRTPKERDRRWREFAVLDFIGLVEQYPGYTAEEYDVETEDGYILKLHRISGSPYSPKSPGKPVAYFGQCLLCSSDLYVVLGPKQALAFQLADFGYDVWIGNFRGNTYSKKHKKYSANVSNYKFWNFSLDEIGLIDLPLLIDTVLAKTNQKKLTYIGYSMGTAVNYILLSSKPKYNDKMNVVVSIAPVAIFKPPYSPLVTLLLEFSRVLESILLSNKMYQLLPQSKLIHIFGRDVCVTDYGRVLCNNILNFIANVKFLNMRAVPTILSHVPAGASFNTVEHFAQLMRSGKFQHFDYGETINKRKYGTSIPPEYNLTKISSPQAIFYSENDVFASVKNTIRLKKKLPNVVAFEKTPADNFNHLDFIWHHLARKYVYNRILKLLIRYL